MQDQTDALPTLSRRRLLRLGMTGFGLVALGAACAPAASPAAAPTSGAAKPTTAAKPADAAKAAPAAGRAAPTGKMVVMVGAEPPSLDVLFASSGAARTPIFDNVVEGLLTVDHDMKLQPSLAESWERLDQTKMRFKLRQGVTFHNGEKLTSEAVVASIKRLVDPELKSQVLAYIDTLDRAEAVDDYTVDILTKGPDPILLRRMTFLGIMPPEFLAKTPDAATDKPVGTGAYRIVEWVKGQRVSLTANDQYWGPQKPSIKDVEFQPRKESSVRLTALKAGEAQLIDNVTPEDAATLPKEQVLSGLATEVLMIRPNSKSMLTADVRVRQALSYAIDRPTLVKAIYGEYAELPSGQLYARTSFGFNPTMQDVPFDLARAQALIKEAGAEGKEITLIGPGHNRYLKDREVMEAVVAMMSKTGLKVNLKLLESAEWLKAGFELENPPMELWCTGAGNELQDPDRILSSYLRTGGRLSMYSNPDVDKMLEAQRAELDEKKRADLLGQLAKRVQDEAILFPLAQLHQIYGVSPKLKFQIIPSALLPINRMELSS